MLIGGPCPIRFLLQKLKKTAHTNSREVLWAVRWLHPREGGSIQVDVRYLATDSHDLLEARLLTAFDYIASTDNNDASRRQNCEGNGSGFLGR